MGLYRWFFSLMGLALLLTGFVNQGDMVIGAWPGMVTKTLLEVNITPLLQGG